MYSNKFRRYNQQQIYNFFTNIVNRFEIKEIKKLIYQSNKFELKKLQNVSIDNIICDSKTDFEWLKKHNIKNNHLILENPNFTIKWFDLFDEEYINQNKIIFKILSYSNLFEKEWLLKFPNMNWLYTELVKHKNFDYECFMLVKNNFVYIEPYIYHNKNFDIKWIIENPELPWNMEMIFASDNFELEWLIHCPKKSFTQKELYYIYKHKKFDIDWIEKLGIEPDFKLISTNNNLTENWFLKYPSSNWETNLIKTSKNYKTSWIIEYPFLEWEQYFYSHNYTFDKKLRDISDFKIEMFLKNPNANWNYQEISSSKYFNESWFKIPNLLLKKLDLSILIKNTNFRIEWVKNNPKLNWDFGQLTYSNKFELEWLDIFLSNENYNKLVDKNIIYSNIVSNSKFKIEWLEQYPILKEYTYFYRILNPNFQLEWLDEYPELNWNLAHISKTKNLTYEWFLKNPDIKWKYIDLFKNENFIRSMSLYNLKYYMKIVKIQMWWARIYHSPYTEIGKRVQKRKYEELFSSN